MARWRRMPKGGASPSRSQAVDEIDPARPPFQKKSRDSSAGSRKEPSTLTRSPWSSPAPSSGRYSRTGTTTPEPSRARASACQPKSPGFASVVKVQCHRPAPSRAAADPPWSVAAPAQEEAAATSRARSAPAPKGAVARRSKHAATATAAASDAVPPATSAFVEAPASAGHSRAVAPHKTRPATSSGGRWGRGGRRSSPIIDRCDLAKPRSSCRQYPRRA